MVDVTAIGSGGGSIAWIDGAGSLKVGPHSAAANPGPACYGRGGMLPTVTDASVVLGLIDPANFAGGTLTLRPELAFAAIEQIVARPLGLTVEQAAIGIHRVLNAQMGEAIRLVSIGRGIDPRFVAAWRRWADACLCFGRRSGDCLHCGAGASRGAVGFGLARRSGGA
jgi:N-methylhydantoinase A/oxoprolinase/acetone carboxylase beta subunit